MLADGTLEMGGSRCIGFSINAPHRTLRPNSPSDQVSPQEGGSHCQKAAPTPSEVAMAASLCT
jgi:hypothetical protein